MMNRFLSGRTGYFLGFLLSFGLVGLALVIQTKYNLEPCPLCISQRMVFMGVGLLFLIACVVNPTILWRKILAVLQAAAAVGGAGVAIRHWYLQAHKDEIIADCGVGFDYMFENFPLRKAFSLVFKGTGDCAAIDWKLLGLTLPQLALIAFISLGFYAIYLAQLKNR